MRLALSEAMSALEEDEVPVGCVVVSGGRVAGKGHNQTERLCDVSAHAELLAISAACNKLGSKYLPSCTLYVTLEPCVMCAGVMGLVHLGRLVYGAFDPKTGYERYSPSPLHPKTEVCAGVLENECAGLLKRFFQKKRNGSVK